MVAVITNAKKDTTVHVRMSARTKREAQKTLRRMGLDVSTAVNLFLHRVVSTQAIPFEVRTENGYTPAQEKQIIKDTEWALKYGKRYDDIDEMHRDIMKKYG
ncbi:type II toxin-antitoxin system RelB/DinJ family antitoxin [Candidatus Kaiserbacteria bacterium]|nr:type II toxin-antitoxin system RelB/DinJ family antitoxin [Candidatus Kaiserbacteria bacterium]